MSGNSIEAAERLRVLILDGENAHHDWRTTTPLLQRMLRESGRFEADIATIPEGEEAAKFAPPDFDRYDAVLSNYNSQHLPAPEFQQAFLDYVHGGGGLVVVHAANNSWAQWPEFNRLSGLGGWYGRDERWGPYVYYRDDQLVRDDSPGRCGHHGPQHEYVVRTRMSDHPIMQGLPLAWLHAKDELYDSLRGPAENMTVLATAYSDSEFAGTGRDEPMLVTLTHGEGRVFHTVMGHADYSMRCVGFITTLLRGTEWAATGEVTIAVPDDFPAEDRTSSR
ncbi:MAG TPA: ThuA domain-containing protein [Lacipirellulaceae bacterium]|nr:ThuA domain-containing protein [Lacipirellulaceae bacterium]HMP06120.1 ThuA domain-containing protein [Lacipirellulaceae bacterium]